MIGDWVLCYSFLHLGVAWLTSTSPCDFIISSCLVQRPLCSHPRGRNQPIEASGALAVIVAAV